MVGLRATLRGVTAIAALVVLLLLVLVLVLLDGILGDASHDSSTDGSEDSVIGLVTGKSARQTTGNGTTETTLTLLGSAGGTLVVSGDKMLARDHNKYQD